MPTLFFGHFHKYCMIHFPALRRTRGPLMNIDELDPQFRFGDIPTRVDEIHMFMG